MPTPPALAEAAILGPTSNLIRRIEIFESDGVTRWAGGQNDDRLIGGAVNVDYSRDERRSMDLELDNTDFMLKHEPDSFWYDKILKVYSGVRYVDTTPEISYNYRYNLALNPVLGTATTQWSTNAGTGGVATGARVTASGSPVADTAYEITWTTAQTVIGGGGYHYATQDVVEGQPHSASIWAKSSKSQRLVMLFYYYNAAGTAIQTNLGTSVVVNADEWTEFKMENYVAPAGATRMLTGVYASNGTGGSLWAVGDKLTLTGVMNNIGSTVYPFFSGASQNFANRAYTWAGAGNLSKSVETTTIVTERAVSTIWETQVGEFLIDNISEDHFPHTVKVNGRDYTKRCMTSKFVAATMFAKNTPIENAIKSMAQNAGIVKFLLPLTGKTLGKDYFFERGVTRWEAMKQIANSFGFDLFFDGQGYLVLKEYSDPVTAPLAYTFQTGPIIGNLAGYTKSLNDTRMYNHIVVTGESSGTEIVPVWAEALNTDPLSPTRISKIGDRVYQYTSIFITTEAQALDVANKFLAIHALEEFEFSFSSIALPWLEVGEIIRFEDPRPHEDQPDRFLLSTLTIPMDLGPMSGSGKRVAVIR